MALSQRVLTIGGAGAAAALAALTYVVGVGPQLSHASSLKAQGSAAEDTNTRLSSTINHLKVENASLETFKQQRAAQLIALPSAAALPLFTRDVADLAASNAVAITSLAVGAPAATDKSAAADPGQETPTDGLYEIPISLVVTGTSGHELSFLHALQTTEPRAVLVSGVQMSASQTVTMTIAFTVYLSPKQADK